MAARSWLLGMFAALAFACGSNSGSNGDGGNDGDGGGADGDGGINGGPDAFIAIDGPPFGGTCTPIAGAPQCSDCVDNDNDARIDGFDPECSGPLDRLEDSFATGIPGDNMDSTYQDCFFDGDSGGGNDGCSTHVCCLLQADNIAECGLLAPDSNEQKYKKSECYKPWGTVDVPAKCTMNCGPLAPPGCDCFGCCTICNGTGCEDIITNPAVSPNCDQTNITSPGVDGIEGTADDPCQRCVKTANCGSTECASDPNGTSCVPCPGQCNEVNNVLVCDPPLPTSCTGSTCPQGYQACDNSTDPPSCPGGSYCSTGCCVGILL